MGFFGESSKCKTISDARHKGARLVQFSAPHISCESPHDGDGVETAITNETA